MNRLTKRTTCGAKMDGKELKEEEENREEHK